MANNAFTISFFLTVLMLLSAMSNAPNPVTVEELIDNQNLYHGKEVAVKGYIGYGFENCIIWPNDPETVRIPLQYWIWYRQIEGGCGTASSVKEVKYGPAIVRGVFDKTDKGHLGSYSATISEAKIQWL